MAGNPRVTLEIEADGNPIRGTIDHGDGTPQAFWGWLELIEALGRIATGGQEPRTGPRRATTGRPPTPTPQ